MKLRVGLVGLGEAWETRHRPSLLALNDRFEVRAVCEQVAHRADKVAAEFRAVTVDGFRVLAEREDIDALLMLAPQWYGHLPVLAACENGKAVYCASVMDLEPQQAQELRDRVEKSGIAFMAEFPRRLAPATLRLKELIATRLGRPRLLFCHERKSRKTRGEVSGGPLAMAERPLARSLLELIDWCQYVVGVRPTSVIGVCSQATPQREDYRMMSVEFGQSGDPAWTRPIAQISCGDYLSKWPEATTFRPPAALQVHCEKGVAFVDLPSSLVWFDEAGRHMESLEADRPVGEQLFVQFHRSVTSLVRKVDDLADACTNLNAVAAAEESFRSGRRIPLR
jgi:predicted dehydrogenase